MTPPIVSVQAVSRILRPSSEPELEDDVLEALVRGGEGRKEGRDRLGERTCTIIAVCVLKRLRSRSLVVELLIV